MIRISDETVLSVHESLLEDGAFEPLSTNTDDERAWLDLELASLVEGHFQEVIEPSAMTDAERESWVEKATHGEGLEKPDREFSTPYWLLHRSERVGTFALSTLVFGWDLLRVSSLYVQPDRRRLGIASRALRMAYERAVGIGARGLRVPTNWTWQPTLRFYTRRGLWVAGWKHDLVFDLRSDLPAYQVQFKGKTRAVFSVLKAGVWNPLIEAEHQGDRLGWRESEATEDGDDFFIEARYRAPGTLAVHLALEGWPIIRSDQHWAERYRWSDMGMPEGLVLKIAVFEAVSRDRGFNVKTPPVPGLDYSDVASQP